MADIIDRLRGLADLFEAGVCPRRSGGEVMTLVPNETEQALNRQHDVYAAAREEYRKKIAEQAAEIERLRAALEEIAEENIGNTAAISVYIARAALEGAAHDRQE